MSADPTVLAHLRELISILERDRDHPDGPPVVDTTRASAADACKALCGGDANRARTLWKLIQRNFGGYMPHAAAVALIYAASTQNLVPDVEAPDPS